MARLLAEREKSCHKHYNIHDTPEFSDYGMDIWTLRMSMRLYSAVQVMQTRFYWRQLLRWPLLAYRFREKMERLYKFLSELDDL